jgi:hypothetical protein
MINSPVNDFSVIMSEQEQPVIIRRIVRTVDTNGKTTKIETVDFPTTALVDEYKKIIVDVQGAERNIIGDVTFTFYPDEVITQLDKIIWEGNTFVIKNLKNPTRIVKKYLYRKVEAGREDIS